MGLLARLRGAWEAWRLPYQAIPAARALDAAIALRDAGKRPQAHEAAAALVSELRDRPAVQADPYAVALLVLASCLMEQLADDLRLEGLGPEGLGGVLRVVGAAAPLPGKYADQVAWLRSRAGTRRSE